jgi:hypothetical protein
MKPIFTIHAGEYLFGNAVEARFPKLRNWIPSKDNGIDFLITDEFCKEPLSIQVKYSKDFNWSHGNPKLKPHVKSIGWYSLTREKIELSKADYWVLVNYDGMRRDADFLFIKPSELLTKFDSLGRSGKRIESYILITNENNCYETRGIGKKQLESILIGELDNTNRDLKSYLSNWNIIKKHFNL